MNQLKFKTGRYTYYLSGKLHPGDLFSLNRVLVGLCACPLAACYWKDPHLPQSRAQHLTNAAAETTLTLNQPMQIFDLKINYVLFNTVYPYVVN